VHQGCQFPVPARVAKIVFLKGCKDACPKHSFICDVGWFGEECSVRVVDFKEGSVLLDGARVCGACAAKCSAIVFFGNVKVHHAQMCPNGIVLVARDE